MCIYVIECICILMSYTIGIHVMESDSKKSKRQAVVQFHNHDGAVLGKKQLQKKQHDIKFTYLSYDEAVKWLASKNHYQHPRGVSIQIYRVILCVI